MKKGSEILAVDLSLQHVLWRQKSPGEAAWYSAKPYIFQNCLLFGTDKGDIFAFRITDVAKIWTHHLKGEKILVFGSSKNVLYVGTLKGTLYAAILSPTARGEGAWRMALCAQRIPGPVKHPQKLFIKITVVRRLSSVVRPTDPLFSPSSLPNSLTFDIRYSLFDIRYSFHPSPLPNYPTDSLIY
jgi:hypothetical protein